MNEIVVQKEISTGWVEQLALEELNMEESGIIHFQDHINPIHFIEAASIQFVDHLRELFDLYVGKFNEYRGSRNDGSQVKIFRIAGTVNDFMLFRNSLRLIIARRSSDIITIGFIASSGEVYSAKIHSSQTMSHAPHEIRAHIGPFNNITWRFDGEIIDPDSMVKYYMSEFLRKSAK